MGRATIGVSLKMYFGHAQTLAWMDQVADLARDHPSIADGSVELFVIPGFVAIVPSLDRLKGSLVAVGAQNLSTDDAGAFTGEVSGRELAEVGVTVVEVGHAERRSLFGETDNIVAAKTAAALRSGLSPVLCVGEGERTSPADAASACRLQLESALADAPAGRVIVAYEPVWAIGAAAPADPDYVREVCARLRGAVADRPGSTVIYGGSAGPGLLTELGDDVDGLFLGRFVHDISALERVLDDAAARS